LCIGTTQIGGDGPPYFPMARAIVGGLLFSTFVSLVLLPTIYSWLDVIRHWPRKLLKFLQRWLKPVANGLAWPVRKIFSSRQPS
jgi:HAE1 family hydrophobic/amphiphilic exporter-1